MEFVEFLAQSEHKITLWTDKPRPSPREANTSCKGSKEASGTATCGPPQGRGRVRGLGPRQGGWPSSSEVLSPGFRGTGDSTFYR